MILNATEISTRHRAHVARRGLAVTAIAAMALASTLAASPTASADPGPPDSEQLTPGAFAFKAPAEACKAQITLTGASGASGEMYDGDENSTNMGHGATVTFTIPATAGQVFSGTVGGQGGPADTAGSNGGGAGAYENHAGGGGGGYSEVSTNSRLLAIAGGGGGGGGGHDSFPAVGGDAGVPTATGTFAGSNGGPGVGTNSGGQGGQIGGPGAGGVNPNDSGYNGSPASGHNGGNGTAGNPFHGGDGGGGGGGYFGGGGGAGSHDDEGVLQGGGGGGGSSFLDPSASFVSGSLAAGFDGSVKISWTTCSYGIGLTKSASPQRLKRRGQRITFSYVVTNTGKSPLGQINVVETSFSGGQAPIVVCPTVPGGLQPGQSITCTAKYRATRRDLRRGKITSVAVANGTAASSTRVSSQEAAVVIKGKRRVPRAPHTGARLWLR